MIRRGHGDQRRHVAGGFWIVKVSVVVPPGGTGAERLMAPHSVAQRRCVNVRRRRLASCGRSRTGIERTVGCVLTGFGLVLAVEGIAESQNV
jgi:hypothetical protein